MLRPSAPSRRSQTTHETPASAAEAAVIRTAAARSCGNSIPPSGRRSTRTWATTLTAVAIAVPATMPATPKGL